MSAPLSSLHAAIVTCRAFRALTHGGLAHPGGEIALFDALAKALNAATPFIKVAIYHGSSHQVFHDTAPLVGLGVRRCELSDLAIVAFDAAKRVPPRISFLQAKYERRALGPPSHVPVLCDANYVQWSLLSSRTSISGYGKRFIVPPDLLSRALLPSVGSFGFFHEGGGSGKRAPKGPFEFVYASAHMLVPAHSAPTKRKEGRVHVPMQLQYRIRKKYPETVAAPTLLTFLIQLFELTIGTPVIPGRWGGHAWVLEEVEKLARHDGHPVAIRLAKRLSNFRTYERGEATLADFPVKRVLLIETNSELD